MYTSMDLDTYQERTRETAVYPEQSAVEYLALGLNDEAGEVAGAFKKYLRGDYGEDTREAGINAEQNYVESTESIGVDAE